MTRHLIISLILLLSFFFTSIALAEEKPLWWEQAEAEAERQGYNLITLDGLQRLYDSDKDFLIVDVRPDYEYKSGHLPNAANIEFHLGERLALDDSKREAFEDLLGADKNRTIVIYCRSFR